MPKADKYESIVSNSTYKLVTLYYGSYYNFHTLIDSDIKLNSLTAELSKLGFRVRCVKLPETQILVAVICHHEVFRCNIANMRTGTHAIQDPIASRAIQLIVEASEAMARTATYSWIYNEITYRLFHHETIIRPKFIKISKDKNEQEQPTVLSTKLPSTINLAIAKKCNDRHLY